uniref:Uncharacterized protein n=1 Tax=Anopheles minimus TaxID=112268 RepID=A0A182VXU3_9DIPT
FQFRSPNVRWHIGETLSLLEHRQSIRDFFLSPLSEVYSKNEICSKFRLSVTMKQNSTKPSTTAKPLQAGNRPSMQHGHHHHHQQTAIHQQHMQHPVAVTYHQQQSSYQSPQPQQQLQQHYPHNVHQPHQQHQPGCIVLPSTTTMHQQSQHTYLPQQSGRLGNVATSVAPMYVAGTVMGQQTAQQAAPAGFSTSAQQPPASYLQTVQHHQPSMSQVQRPEFQPTMADFVAASAVPGSGFSGAHQPYKQQPQRQAQPMQSYQEAPTTTSYPVHIQSSLHPEGSTTEAQRKLHNACRAAANIVDAYRMQKPNVYEL